MSTLPRPPLPRKRAARLLALLMLALATTACAHPRQTTPDRARLVRVEVDQSVTTSDEIDAISSWLLAERTPRATGDARWATLLYPVHQLERVLKRQLDAQTRGWAGN